MNYKKIKNVNKDEHILIMEKYLGRPLENGEVVHHIDENKKHNEIENLELCLLEVHSRYHQQKGDYFNVAQWSKDNLTKGHGTYASWRRGCRCEPCKIAMREYKKDYRRRTGIH
jgi:hypothetical protein